MSREAVLASGTSSLGTSAPGANGATPAEASMQAPRALKMASSHLGSIPGGGGSVFPEL
jgi:hypothetical protein